MPSSVLVMSSKKEYPTLTLPLTPTEALLRRQALRTGRQITMDACVVNVEP
jgi:hypothetical protein